MNINEYLEKFFGLLLDPLVFLGFAIGFVFLNLNRHSLKVRWILVALLALVASFAEYRDQYVPDPPDLVFPLETIRSYGRPISVIILLTLTIFIVFFKLGSDKLQDRYYILRALLAIQILVFVKNLIYGSTIEAILSFLIFLLIFNLFHAGVTRWANSLKMMHYGAWCIVAAVFLFNLMGLYQTSIDPWPMFFQQNRYLGMTGNPQHAAVLLASSLPVIFFLIISSRQLHFKVFLIVLLGWSIYDLVLTGSRTGLLEAAVTGLIFLGGYSISSLKWGSAILLIFLVVRTSINWDFSQDVNQNIEGYSTRRNTRIEVINSQFRQFLRYPIFGHPLRGDRLRYGENSYGAVAAALGSFGLIPLIIFVRGLILIILKLWRKSKQNVIDRHYYLLVIAGIVSLLVGAFLEAYLLGNLTWPLIMILLYTTWGYYLLSLQDSKEVEAEDKQQYTTVYGS